MRNSLRERRSRLRCESLESRRMLAATVTIGSALNASPGQTVQTPISIVGGQGLQAIDFVILYDTTRLNLSNADILRGALLSGWSLTPSVNDSLGKIAISAFTTTPLVAGSGTLFNLNFHIDAVAPGGSAAIDLPPALNEFALNEGLIAMTVVAGSIQIADSTPPVVTQVFASSSSWTPGFRNAIVSAGLGASDGYAFPRGAAQTAPLPWNAVDRVAITFNEPVTVSSSDLQVTGSAGAIGISTFAYQAATRTATWTLATPLPAGDVNLLLTGVKDVAGNLLDGEWTTQQLASTSGNGAAGGDFQFEFRSLPGDATQDGTVDAADYTVWADHFLSAHPEQVPLINFNGDGLIDAGDYTVWADHFLESLPSAAPAWLPSDAAPALLIAEPKPALEKPAVSVERATTTLSQSRLAEADRARARSALAFVDAIDRLAAADELHSLPDSMSSVRRVRWHRSV